jgi:hypothetical protein
MTLVQECQISALQFVYDKTLADAMHYAQIAQKLQYEIDRNFVATGTSEEQRALDCKSFTRAAIHGLVTLVDLKKEIERMRVAV